MPLSTFVNGICREASLPGILVLKQDKVEELKWGNAHALLLSFCVGSYKALIKDSRSTIFANVNESYAKAIYHIGL